MADLIGIARSADGNFIWAGSSPGASNSSAGFVVVQTGTPGTDEFQLGLAARPTGSPTSYNPTVVGNVTHFTVPAEGMGVRFAYSVASEGLQLSDYTLRLKMDLDPSAGFNLKTFILQPYAGTGAAALSPSGYAWVWDANNNGSIDGNEAAVLPHTSAAGSGNYIADDQGNSTAIGKVTQNIENLSWFDATPGNGTLTKGSYDIVLEALGPGIAGTLTNKITLDVAGGALRAQESSTDLIVVAKNGTHIWAGTSNSAANFVTVEGQDVSSNVLQLGLTARQTLTGTTYTTSTIGGVTHYAASAAGSDIRFAYSIASSALTLDKFDIKLKMDLDAGAGTSFKTFILQDFPSQNGSGFAWVWDADNNGKIDGNEAAVLPLAGPTGSGNYIADDQGSSIAGDAGKVTQNIENLAWFDQIAGDVLAKGSYDVVLQAFDKGNGATASAPVIENRIVIDVAGGAPPPSGGGGSTPPTTPPPTTTPPFTPPPATDPSPADGFNEAQAAASVTAFFTGEVPTPAKQAELNAFAALQYEAYAAQGVANPALGPYEALGRGFAETAEFATKYGLQTESEFISMGYLEVFGRAPTADQQAHFQAQVDYFEAIYEAAGISSAQAELYAKGAALGQMIGFATLEPTMLAVTTAKSVAFADWDLAA